MKLKCVGGEHDGEWYNSNRELYENDFVRLPIYPKTTSFEYDPYKISPPTINYEVYKLMTFHWYNKNEVMHEKLSFLVPPDWTLMQAVKHQFGK